MLPPAALAAAAYDHAPPRNVAALVSPFEVEEEQEAPSVRKVGLDAFLTTNGAASASKHEGIVPWPYLDKLGLVTTAVGNLIEDARDGALDSEGKATYQTTGAPTAAFYSMGWKNPDGSLSSEAQMTRDWNAIKAAQNLHTTGGGSPLQAALTTIRLGPANARVGQVTPEIAAVVQKEIDRIENIFATQIPSYETWPADAQLAIMHWAWAKGASFSGWPKLHAALTASPPDFHAAAVESHLSNAEPSLNVMISQMFENAANVVSSGADPDTVYFPGTVDAPGAQSSGAFMANLAPQSFGRGSTLMPITAKFAIGVGLAASAAAAYAYWKGQ